MIPCRDLDRRRSYHNEISLKALHQVTPKSRSDWMIVCFGLRVETFSKVEMLWTGYPALSLFSSV